MSQAKLEFRKTKHQEHVSNTNEERFALDVLKLEL